jgi:hypothetical protein
VIDVYECVRPEALLQLFTSEHAAGAFEQYGEDLKWLTAKLQFDAGFTKFSRFRVHFEDPEADQSGGLAVRRHCREPQLPQF